MRRALLLVPMIPVLAAGLASCGGGSDGGGDFAIAQITFNIAASTAPALTTNSFTFSVRHNDTGSTIVGNGISVTPADQGSTFTVGPADDPEFAALALTLMNGINDPMHLEGDHDSGGSGQNGTESSFLVGLVPGFTGPDLAGYTITRIQIVIDQLSVTPIMGGTAYSWSVRFVFFGR